MRSFSEYANSQTSSGLAKDVYLIEKEQRKTTNLVHQMHNLSYDNHVQRPKPYKLYTKKFRRDIILAQHVIEYNIEEISTFSTHSFLSGHNQKLTKKRPRTHMKLNVFFLRIWEHLE